MKKLSIILLALAFALVMTVPALAIHIGDDGTAEGGLGITGTYKIDGQSNDDDGTKSAAYDDDFEVVLKFATGPVVATIDLEISDDGSYDGKDITRGADIVDNYYVTYQAMDALMFKFGEYSCAFGRAIGTDGACAHNIQATYSLDAADITLILSKEDELGEDDDDAMVIKVDVKEAGPFTTLSLASYTDANDGSGDPESSYTGLDVALPIGPVAFAMEYGANGSDNEGNFMLFEIGLEELIGFDVTINYFMSSDDYLAPYSGDDYAPLGVFFDEVNDGQTDATALWVDFGYGVNDNLSVSAAVLAMAENDAGDDLGTEFDVGMKYKLADNVTYQASYASFTEGDVEPDRSELFHRLTLKF